MLPSLRNRPIITVESPDLPERERQIVDTTAEWVRARSRTEGSHDWFHVERVWRMAQRLCVEEMKAQPVPPIDSVVVELAALLHDISDAKFNGGDEKMGPEIAAAWLNTCAGLSPQRAKQVGQVVATMSFRHRFDRATHIEQPSREFAVVRDADRLDAIGAVGIARAFAYGGAKGRAIHDPDQQPETFASREAYLSSSGSSLSHFYEKLFLLRDEMLTASGRAIADSRHEYMHEFVKQFLEEWRGSR